MDLRTGIQGLPVLEQFSADGFVDCVFAIRDLRRDGDRLRFELRADHAGEVVGLNVEMVRSPGPGFDEDMNLIAQNVHRRGATFRSSGAVSDRLMAALASLYGVSSEPRSMVLSESFTLIVLQQSDVDIEVDAVRMKLFGRDEDETGHYQSFFNLDVSAGLAFWNEKDPDYREPLLRAMSSVGGAKGPTPF